MVSFLNNNIKQMHISEADATCICADISLSVIIDYFSPNNRLIYVLQML